jgi:hypothetical protein
MKVDEILSFGKYYLDRRFASKKPDLDSKHAVCKCGDNIYEPLPEGAFKQLRSQHSKDKGPEEDRKTKETDLSGENVLISWNFHYFGSQGPELPHDLKDLKVGIGHKCNFRPEVIRMFKEFIAKQPKGVIAPPTMWR